MSASLDGFAAAPDGSLDWVIVDDELHTAFNDEAREMDVFAWGRRTYELMNAYWPTALDDADATPVERDFALIYRDTPKLVFSRSLESVADGCELDVGDAVARVSALKAEGKALGVGGPTLAGSMLAAGLLDEVRVYVNPVVLGSGLRFFPALDAPVRLRLVEERRFASGVVLLRHEVERPEA
jgi:dihydrofolate reductase